MTGVAGALLAQNKPTGTTAVTLFSASMRTEVTRIVCTNLTTNNVVIYIYHDDVGTTYADTTALVYGKQISNSDVYTIEAGSVGSGITIFPGGSLGCKVNSGNTVNFSVYGQTEQR